MLLNYIIVAAIVIIGLLLISLVYIAGQNSAYKEKIKDHDIIRSLAKNANFQTSEPSSSRPSSDAPEPSTQNKHRDSLFSNNVESFFLKKVDSTNDLDKKRQRIKQYIEVLKKRFKDSPNDLDQALNLTIEKADQRSISLKNL